MMVVRRLALAVIVFAVIGCGDDGVSTAPTPTPSTTRSATAPPATASATPSPPTPTPRPPSCCEGVNFCRETGPGSGTFCKAGETPFPFPYECTQTTHCALPTTAPSATATIPTRTATRTPTVTPTIPTPTFTQTPRELQATCCQPFDSQQGCYEPLDRFCQYGVGGYPYEAPYACNSVSGLCEIPVTPTQPDSTPTPTPTKDGCHQAKPCDASEFCQPPGEPFCLSGPTPTQTGTPACRDDEDCTASDPDTICDVPRPPICGCCRPILCVLRCNGDGDCLPEEACATSGHCVARPCAADSDCPQHFACPHTGPRRPSCRRRGCDANSECGNGYCVNGACYGDPGTCMLIPQ